MKTWLAIVLLILLPVTRLVTAMADNIQEAIPGKPDACTANFVTGAGMHSEQENKTDQLNVRDAGAKGNGTDDDTIPIRKLAATRKSLYFPSGTYLYNPSGGALDVREKWYGDGKGNSVIKVIGNGTLINRLSGSYFDGLSINLNGEHYSGTGFLFRKNSPNTLDINVEVRNAASGMQALEFESNAGSGFVSLGSTYQTLTPGGQGSAVKFNVDTQATPRAFINTQSAGCTLFDFGGSNDTFVYGGYSNGLLFSGQSSKVMISNMRVGAGGGSVTIRGGEHQVMGAVFATDVTLNTTNTRFESGTPDNNITDNGSGNLVFSGVREYKSNWTGDAKKQPVIGNGTLSAMYERSGRMIDVIINLTMGTTTETGTGAWYFSLPEPDYTPYSYLGQASAYQASSGRYYPIIVRQVTGQQKIQLLLPDSPDPVSENRPFNWMNKDKLTISFHYFRT